MNTDNLSIYNSRSDLVCSLISTFTETLVRARIYIYISEIYSYYKIIPSWNVPVKTSSRLAAREDISVRKMCYIVKTMYDWDNCNYITLFNNKELLVGGKPFFFFYKKLLF